MRRPIVFALCSLVFASSACTSSQGTTTSAPTDAPLPPPIHFAAKPAAADGYIFTNPSLASEPRTADGWREGGIALARDATAPAGFSAFSGNVQLLDPATGAGVASARPDAQGLASFTNVAAGRYTLRVQSPTAHDFPITLIGGATVRWGTYPVTRPSAFEIAKKLIAGTIRPNFTFIAAPQTPVPGGVILSPALGDAEGRVTAASDHTITKPSWFFYVNPFAELRFDHEVKYVLVDATTGDASAIDADSWPALNRQTYYQLNEDQATSADVLLMPTPSRASLTDTIASQRGLNGPAPRGLAVTDPGAFTIAADHVPGCASSITYALLVQGSDEGPQNADMKNIRKLLPPSSVIYEDLPGGPDRPAAIDSDWKKIEAAATVCDSTFVYVTAHASNGGLAELATSKLHKLDGSPMETEGWAPSYLDWDNCHACHITVILDYCFSGQQLGRLQTILQHKTGKKVFVLASSDKSHKSGSYYWFDPTGATGGAFTNALVSAFTDQSAGGATPSMGNVFDAANATVSGTIFRSPIREQNPQYWERKLQPGETCAVQPTSTIDRRTTPPPTVPPPTTPPPTTAPPTQSVPRQTTGAGLPTTTARATGSVSPLARVNVVAFLAEGANNSTSTSVTDPVVGRVYTAVCPSPNGTTGATWRLYIRVEGQNINRGDQVHLTLSGPNMPAEVTMTLDDVADTTLNLPGHTSFIGPFPNSGGNISITITADSVNGVPLAFKPTLQRGLTCN